MGFEDGVKKENENEKWKMKKEEKSEKRKSKVKNPPQNSQKFPKRTKINPK